MSVFSKRFFPALLCLLIFGTLQSSLKASASAMKTGAHRRIRRVVIMPYSMKIKKGEKWIQQILPDRMNLFFNGVPGFLAVAPPDESLKKEVKEPNPGKAPNSLLNIFKKVNADYVLMGFIRGDGIHYYLLDIANEKILHKAFRTKKPCESGILNLLVLWAKEQMGKDFTYKKVYLDSNLKRIRYKSIRAFREYIQAQSLMNKGEGPDKVLSLINSSLKREPDSLSARTLLAQALVKMGEIKKAIRIYDEVLSDDPGFLPAVTGKGLLYIANGKVAEAASFLEKNLKKMPDNILLMYNCAYSRERAGDVRKAELLYRGIIARDPFNQVAIYNLATLYFKNHKFRKSLPLFQKLEKLNPGDNMYAYNTATVYLHLGELERARTRLLEIARSGDFKEVYNDLGIIERRKRNFKEAEKYFKQAIKVDPQYSPAYNNLGILYLIQGKKPEARKNFDEAIRYNIRNADALYNLGLLSLAEGDLDRAYIFFSRAVDITPKFFNARVNLAITEMYRGNIEEAEYIYRDLEKDHPRNAIVLYNRGVLYRNISNPAKALPYFEKALKIKPDMSDALNNIAVILIGRGKLNEASNKLDKALIVSPENPVYLFNRGLASYYGKAFKKAAGYFQKALESDTGFFNARMFLIRSYIQDAKYEKARRNINILLKENPSDYRVEYLLAVFYERTEQAEKAIDLLEKIVDRMEDYLEGYRRLGMLYINMGRYKDAEKIFRKLTGIDSSDYRSWLNLGVSQKMQKKKKEAEKSLKNAVKAAPTNASVHYQLGLFYAESGRFKDAGKLFAAAVRMAPRNVDYLSSLAMAQAMAGNPVDAEKTLKKALEVSPDNPVLLYRLAFIYLKMDSREKMMEALRLAVEKDPTIKKRAIGDEDFKEYWNDPEFRKIME